MKRATITIPDELETQLDTYLSAQEAPPSLAVLVQAALRRYLAEKQLEQRQYRPARGPLSVTPAAAGSGSSGVSAEHDRELADTR